MTVLAVIEHDAGDVNAATWQALDTAVAVSAGEPVEAVSFGHADGLEAQLAARGVSRLHVLEHEMLSGYSPEAWGASLAQLLKQAHPAGVVAPGTDRGNELMAQAAARARLPLATNCLSVEGGAETWRLSRARVGGLLLEDAELTSSIKLVTLVPGPDDGSAVAENTAPASVAVEVFTPDLGMEFAHSRIVRRSGHGTGVTLASAKVVVSGGRGVGSAEGFAPLEELAELLGGAVGCSRVATSNGWRPHSDQVGQTGTRISPDLYIACGISGATQHWVGCMGARAILAINTDSEAALVNRATYAVVGDVHDVVPAVIEAIRRRSGQPTRGRPALT